jgi:hypothetical protein
MLPIGEEGQADNEMGQEPQATMTADNGWPAMTEAHGIKWMALSLGI